MNISRLKGLPFPILQSAVYEAHGNIQGPYELTLMAALAAVSSACQGAIDVELPFGGIVPASLMLIVAAKSGERKTSTENRFFQGINELQREECEKYKTRYTAWEKDKARKDIKIFALEKEIKKRVIKGGEVSLLEESVEDIKSSISDEPVLCRYIHEDVTSPALYNGLEKFPYASLISNEGGGVLKGSAFNDFSKLNTVWSGGRISVARATAPSYILDDVRLTISLMIQPEILSKYSLKKGDEWRASGGLARAIVCMPISTQGERFIDERTHEWECINAFSTKTKKILSEVGEEFYRGNKRRRVICFSEGARHRWVDFYNWVEGQIGKGGRFEFAGDHASKLAENAARVAALLHYFEGKNGDVAEESLVAAIDICMYMSDSFSNLFSSELPDEMLAELLRKYLLQHKREKSYRIRKNDILQYGPNRLRNKDSLERALNVLYRRADVDIYKEMGVLMVGINIIF